MELLYILRASFEALGEGHPHKPRVLSDFTSQLVCQAWLQMTSDCSKNQNYPQGHGGLPTTEHVKINVPQVSSLILASGQPLLGSLSDKHMLAEVLSWPDIQGSGVIGLSAPSISESLWAVVTIMKWLESESDGPRAPSMGDDTQICLNSEDPPSKVGCQLSSSCDAPQTLLL